MTRDLGRYTDVTVLIQTPVKKIDLKGDVQRTKTNQKDVHTTLYRTREFLFSDFDVVFIAEEVKGKQDILFLVVVSFRTCCKGEQISKYRLTPCDNTVQISDIVPSVYGCSCNPVFPFAAILASRDLFGIYAC